MSKKKSKSALKRQAKEERAHLAAQELFNSYYSHQYGVDRWKILLQYLSQPVQYCALGNKYADKSGMENVLGVGTDNAQIFHPTYFDKVYVKKRKYSSDNGLFTNGKDEIVQLAQEENNDNDDKSDVAEIIKQEETNVAIHEDDEDSDDDPLLLASNTRWPSPLLESSLCPITGRCVYYPMDAASLLPVKMLDLQPHHKVIDLCAAPGGKSLAIAQYLNLMDESKIPRDDPVSVESYGKLVCCDISPLRRARLKNVLRQYLPTAATSSLSGQSSQLLGCHAARVEATTVFEESGNGSVHVVGGDYTNYTAIQSLSAVAPADGFDRVLVDAPCSTERHLILTEYQTNHKSGNKRKDGKAGLVGWGPGRSRRNAQRQIRLLQTALRLCKRGGRVVYSTCSLSAAENDDVIRKVINKCNRYDKNNNDNDTGEDSARLGVTPLPSYDLPFGEPTEFGWHVLPDTSGGWGPIYLAVLTVE